MPFKMTPGLVIVGIICFVLIIGVIAAVASSGGGKKPSANTPGTATCTVQGEIGLSSVKITNMNTRTSTIKTISDLPFSFNFTKGDQLQFTASTLPDFTFNSWTFNTGTFDDHNPVTLKAFDDITLTADVILESELP